MITIKHLSLSYKKGVNIINDLSLDLSKATIHGVVGFNGAGKTTLLDSIFGLKKTVKGEIIIDNELPTKKKIAYLPTENYFYSNITGKEYLALFENSDFDLDNWNRLFKLQLDVIIDTYSTGMKKKLAFLGILKQDKPYLILDEPFNGLDVESCRVIHMILLRLKEQGKTIIITSHIIESLTQLCDQLHFLDKGKIQLSSNRENFKCFVKNIVCQIESKNLDLIDCLML
ncbi:MAG: ATP-binding cassette domain-containing protein [Bacteroidales bacterium]